MKITIDTKEDSHEEIKKIIKMLSSLVGEGFRTNQPDVFADDKPLPDGGVFGNLFGSQEKSEEKEETPEIVEY